jgi:hypothetical protein
MNLFASTTVCTEMLMNYDMNGKWLPAYIVYINHISAAATGGLAVVAVAASRSAWITPG